MTPEAPLRNARTSAHPITVHLPDGNTLEAQQQGELQITNLASPAATAHVIPHLKHNLLSVGQLCDAGLTATFSHKISNVKFNVKQIN